MDIIVKSDGTPAGTYVATAVEGKPIRGITEIGWFINVGDGSARAVLTFGIAATGLDGVCEADIAEDHLADLAKAKGYKLVKLEG
jgi:hypothetical protein